MKKKKYPEERALHVIAHLAVIQRHYPHQTLKGCGLHLNGWVLGSLAYYLHDVIALALRSQDEPVKPGIKKWYKHAHLARNFHE